MTADQLSLLLCASIFLAVVVVAGYGYWSERHTALRKRVMVNLTTGEAISGVLWARRGHWLVVRDAALVSDGGTSTAMDGEALVDRGRVAFVQVLG